MSNQDEPSRGTPEGESETILIIDDEPLVLDVTQRMVEHLGYKTLTARNGAEAVEVARTFEGEIHLAMLDMWMPVMDGWEAYPLLKQARPQMKVLIVSGHGFDASIQALLDAGACAFMRKPFDLEHLGGEIRRALDADSNLPS